MDKKIVLVNMIGRRDYEKIPAEIVKKIEKIVDEFNTKSADLRSHHTVLCKGNEKLQRDIRASNTENSNLTTSLATTQSNVDELRAQLDTANGEVSLLTERVKSEELQNEECRKKHNELVDKNNRLMEISGAKSITISRLQSDLESLQQQFDSVTLEKNNARTILVEIAAKKQKMDDQEKRMIKEIKSCNIEILEQAAKLSEKTSELAAERRKSASLEAKLETGLKQKSDELGIANHNNRQLTELNQMLTKRRDEETVQLNRRLNDYEALIEHYKREVDAKAKYAEMQRKTSDECQSAADGLRNRLQETTEKCERLESTLKGLADQHQSDLAEKDKTIKELIAKVKAAEAEQVENVLEKKFPNAATSNRMLTNNLTLTEIYSRHYDSVGEVHRLEMECLQLNTKLECSTIRLQDTTSEFVRQQTDYRNTLKLNEELTQQMEAVVAEQDGLRGRLNEASQRLVAVESENVQLKSMQKDLARQICNLLNKVETNGEALTSDQQQLKQLGLSNESIRKELITFDNIVELQENNQKLILKVRELSGKVEKLEAQQIGMKCYEEKISYMEQRLNDGEQARLANEDRLAMISRQKDRFKKLYYDAISYMGKPTATNDDAELNGLHVPDKVTNGDDVDDESHSQSLQSERAKEMLQEAFDEYRNQSKINFDMAKEEYDVMERKVVELESSCAKLRSQANFANEQMTTLRNDVAIYKKQVQILEQRNQMYEQIIAEHEQASKLMTDEAWNSIIKLTTAENQCAFLELECRRLLEAKANLEIENNALRRQKVTQSILESCSKLAEISSERHDFEGRLQMEKQFEDHLRGCRSESQKLKGEQKCLAEENESLKRQLENEIRKLTVEQAQTGALRTKLSEAREQIESKNQQNKRLSVKLQASYTSSSRCTLSKKSQSFLDLEAELKIKNGEIERLKMELLEHETKSKRLETCQSNHDAETTELRANLEASMLSESNLKAHIDELQQEIRNQSLGKSSPETEKKLEDERNEASRQITEQSQKISVLRSSYERLENEFQTLQNKYSDELSEHASDVQILKSRNIELNDCQERMRQLKLAKNAADELLQARQTEWEATIKDVTAERTGLQQKVNSLEQLNMELVDAMEAENAKRLPTNGETSNANSSILHGTLTDGQLQECSSQTLLGVVQYLRREKVIAAAEYESLNIENARLSAELDMIKTRRVNEPVNVQVKTIDVSLAVASDSRRTVETLNAVTDSNLHLRAEKTDLENRVTHLSEKLTSLSTELLQMQQENRQLLETCDEKDNNNTMLRGNIDKLKEQEKLLRNEGERLTQLFTDEKEKLRLANEKLLSMNSSVDQQKKLFQDVAAESANISQEEMNMTPEKLPGENELETRKAATQTFPDTQPDQESNAVSTKTGPRASNSKRTRDNDSDGPSDLNGSSATEEKSSPQPKRSRLDRTSSLSQRVPANEDVGSTINADDAIDGDDAEYQSNNDETLPGPQGIAANQKPNEIGDGVSSTRVGEDIASEVESIDSGVSSEWWGPLPADKSQKDVNEPTTSSLFQRVRRSASQNNDGEVAGSSQAVVTRRVRTRKK